jgi:mono/diheme cytochrome c family protein
MTPTETASATEPAIPKDPLIHKSYSVPVAISMLLVVGATALACVDEMWWRRPYKAIQSKYHETYSAYLEKVETQRRAVVDGVVKKLDEYKTLEDAAKAATAATAAEAGAIDAELKTATDQGRKLSEALKIDKSQLAAWGYEAETKSHTAGCAKVEDCAEARPLLDKIAKLNATEREYTWTVTTFEDGKISKKDATEKGKIGDLLVKALDLEVKKADLQQKLGKSTKAATDASKAREDWLAHNLGDLKYALENADDATKKRIAESGAARYLDEDVVALKPDAIAGLRAAVDRMPHSWNIFRDGAGQALVHIGDVPLFGGDIKQIHIKDAANWVDRCETCHLNTREPLPITVESLKDELGSKVGDLPAWDNSKIDSMPLSLFTSHPDVELLKKHDPERFGCSMCHNGNGVAITSTRLAHGENEDWLMPLYPKAHIEAGCVQCHQQDLVLPMGERITTGKDEFRRAGCWGCHKYEGFNKELDQITALNGRLKEIEDEKSAKAQRSQNLQLLHGAMSDDDAALEKDAAPTALERTALQQEIAGLDTEKGQVEKRLRDAYIERQRVGPNLKDVRIKIQREFLTDWIKSPRDAHKSDDGAAFRPETKMPTLRWTDDEEVKDAAAFIWQSAIDPAAVPEYKLPAFKSGDAKKGEELFKDKTVGCVVCHSIGTGANRVGADYAANLSNLGEKDTPEYVARWITHPRERLIAYDRTQEPGKRDVAGHKPTDADAEKFVWTNHTIMPNFRLSESDVRDITTYLVSQKRSGVKYEEPTWLDDKSRFERGKKLVMFQGCASCHEIAGLEDEKGIGTELTQEGSKPIERLDFGHHTIAAERGIEPLKGDAGKVLLEDAAKLFEKDEEWYRPRGFFLHKIAKPDFFDESKYLPDRFTRLRMPQFKFSAQQITDVTTFILGSVDCKIPETSRYHPDEAGQAIREGWWIVKKYNCQGCHQINPTDEPALWNLPFAKQAIKDNKRDQFLPPSLVGVGFRLRPEFLAKFLRDPSLGGGRKEPRSVRAHLPERMPTFDFSEDEIAKLVLFFEALSKQPAVYQPTPIAELTPAERTAAKAMYDTKGSCVQCHVVNGVPVNEETKGPNLSYAPERLRHEWATRWVRLPTAMQPNTQMTKNFGDEPGKDGKWHFSPDLPELKGISSDHAELMVRYVLLGLAGK